MAVDKNESVKTDVVTEKDKWGKVDNGLFVGEKIVELLIPEEDINPAKERFVCINGNQIWLGVGEILRVPQSVASEWNNSYRATMMAKRSMSQQIEIKA